MISETAPRKPLAPVVREDGRWTYAPLPPTDFFTREAFVRELGRYYMGLRPDRPSGVLWGLT